MGLLGMIDFGGKSIIFEVEIFKFCNIPCENEVLIASLKKSLEDNNKIDEAKEIIKKFVRSYNGHTCALNIMYVPLTFYLLNLKTSYWIILLFQIY